MEERRPGLARRLLATRHLDWLLLVVLVTSAAVVRLVLLGDDPVPLVHADEGGYLGNARQLVSGSGRTGDGFFAGYSLFLTPAALLRSDPLDFYGLVLVTNVVLVAASAVVAVLVVRSLFPAATRTQTLGVAAFVFVQPVVFASSGVAMSENAMFLVTLVTTLLLAHAAASDRRVLLGVAGAAGGFAYWISPRGVIVAAAFALALVVASLLGRFSRTHVAVGLGALAASVVGGHVFNRLVKGGADTAGVSGREHGFLHAVLHPEYWSELVARLAGRVAYMGVTTVGLAVVGVVVGLHWAMTRDERLAPLPRRLAGGFAALALGLTLVANALTLDTSVEQRAPHYLYYGRYSEAVALPAIAIGFAWLLDDARRRRALHRLSLALVGLLLGAIAVAHVAAPDQQAKVQITVFNVVGLYSLRRLTDGASFTVMLTIGLAVNALVLALVAFRRQIGLLVLLALMAFVSHDVHEHFFEPGWAERSRQGTLVAAVKRLRARGVPTDCIRVSDGSARWNVTNYRFLLPKTRFESERSVDAHECGPLLVADRIPDPEADGHLLVAIEHAAGVSLSVASQALESGVLDRLLGDGVVFPGATCSPLPDEAYRARIAIVPDEPQRGPGGLPSEVRIAVTHDGRGAPWLAGSLALSGSCGHVRIVVDQLGPAGTVLHSARGDLPHTVFPGDTVAVTMAVADVPAATTLRVALVQDGVTWFRDRGARDLLVELADAR